MHCAHKKIVIMAMNSNPFPHTMSSHLYLYIALYNTDCFSKQ